MNADDSINLAVRRVIIRFDALDPLIDVNPPGNAACTRCRELCHAIDELWALVCPELARYDEFGKRRRP